jgi:TonB family protein
MLDALLQGNITLEEGQSIGLYRVLCLMALGRTAEADRAVEALIAQDPLYQPTADLSPRMRGAFSDARKRMLPSIIQREYVEAKAAFDRQDFATATSAFKRVLDELADPDVAVAANQLPLSDVRTLAAGFHALSVKASAPPPAPAVVVLPNPAAPVRDFRRLYTADDPGVVPPTIVRQSFPKFPGIVTDSVAGMIEVVIDATGTVESAMMRVSLQPNYDRLVLSAAKKWRYEPASVDGVPVKFMKRVQISVTPSTAP